MLCPVKFCTNPTLLQVQRVLPATKEEGIALFAAASDVLRQSTETIERNYR